MLLRKNATDIARLHGMLYPFGRMDRGSGSGSLKRGWVAVCLACWVSPAMGSSGVEGPRHAFSVDDMLAMQRIGDAAVSPDEAGIVLVNRVTDLEANRGRTDLWLVDLDGSHLRQLTTHPENDVSPRWLPGSFDILFLSNRSGSMQIWRISARGGEARQVSRFPLDVTSFILSPDGSKIALSVEVFPGLSIGETSDRLEEDRKAKHSGKLYDRLPVRHWDTWKDNRRAHLFVMPIDGGEPVDLMKHMDADTPSKPFGGTDEYTFTPDGQSLVFSARDVGKEEMWSTDFDLYQVPVDGSKPPRCLTDSNRAWDTHPVFSPDGSRLAYLAMSRPGYEADRFRIMIREWSSGSDRELAASWDRSPHSLCWSGDGKTLYATATHLGQVSLFSIDAATGAVAEIVRDGTVSLVEPAGEELVIALDHLQSPAELYRVSTEGGDLTQITHFNDDRVKQIRWGTPQQFTFEGWNDQTVYGYLITPSDFDPDQKYPVAFIIHGGPQGSFGNHFHYRWNPQAYAGRGYGVVMIDFHGSTGYGQAFTDSIRGDWGGKPLVDLQKGLKAALDRASWLDGDRVCALGASYGGYMINWIAGIWPDRFRCLVCHDGNLDERMAYFDTDELWFPEWDHEGTPWDNPKGYEEQNPVNFVKNWNTPMLVIHGALDYRVVDTQGLSTFTALQRKGIPSKLLYFPDENHWVLKPHNSILWHNTVLDWLDQWTKSEDPTPGSE